MPIFGQVWLWSSLAFLLGALLCWLLVAHPARKRVGDLENQLASRARRQPAERPPESRRRQHDDEEDFARAMVPGLGEQFADESSEYLTRAYALREPPEPPRPPAEPPFGVTETPMGTFTPPPLPPPAPSHSLAPEPPPAAATQYLNVSAGSLPAEEPRPANRGWFDDEIQGEAANQAPEDQPARPALPGRLTSAELPIPGSLDARLVDDEPDEPRSAIEDDSGGTVFTQHTTPIPVEMIRQIDEAGKDEPKRDDALVDDLVDEHPAGEQQTMENEPVPEPTGASNGVVTEDPTVISHPESALEQTQIVEAISEPPAPESPVSEPRHSEPLVSEPMVSESRVPPPPPAREEYQITPGVTVQVQPTPSKLPKRVPSKPQHRVPFGVQPAAADEPAQTGTTTASEPTRALFEPIVPAGDAAPVPPPPHRMREGNGQAGGRGPFGPGSAMPLPGGASPSPEFTIKASVAALRYCTPDSPQFGRTVAEVWFRSAADAERVGFRPVG